MGPLGSDLITSTHVPLPRTQSRAKLTYKGGWEISVAMAPKSQRTGTWVNN